MNRNSLKPALLFLATLGVYAPAALAVPSATSPYITDTINSHVQDQTSQVLGQVNMILCIVGAMGAGEMVNEGNYIALVDQNACGDGGGSGGQSNNTGPAYLPITVNSSRATNADPMAVKAWLDVNNSITVHATASQAPSAALPYGIFRMDYCGNQGSATDCLSDRGYINATSSGLVYYSDGAEGGNTYSTALQLDAISSTAGSGVIRETNTWSGITTFAFAYNANYFIRDDGSSPQCFDRSAANADESVWRYGLYNETTGERITRNSGFPIEYATGGTTYNGYVGYYGLWMQGVTVPTGATVNKVTYTQSGATKTPYTLLKTGGKLMKYTTVAKTLADLNKVKFWYYAQNNVPSSGTAILTAGSQYEIYWDNTATQFKVSGKQNSSTNNMEPVAPTPIDNVDMIAATPWGLYGWSQMLGGQFGIKGSDFATLNSSTPVLTQIQDIVYPSQYADIGNLNCVNDCPTAALIGTSDGGAGNAYANQGWSPIASTNFVTYTLNGTTGNLTDPASAAVLSAATSGVNANGVRTGRMVTDADKTTLISRKNAACSNCDSFNQGDVDLLDVGSSYYVWETGSQSWNQLAILMDGATPVAFEAPLQLSFVVPTGAKYGSYQGATISLQYGGFGDLWGIPNECVDIATNAACSFSGTVTPQNQQRWTSLFAIPFDATAGYVTANIAQGAVTQGTRYLVKPLDMEIRLANITNDATPNACANASLSAPVVNVGALPAANGFQDPQPRSGVRPVFTTPPAPHVIQGIRQY